MQTKKRCLVCEKEVDTRLVETYGEYSILECATCELQFAHSLDYGWDSYERAYNEDGDIFDGQVNYPLQLANLTGELLYIVSLTILFRDSFNEVLLLFPGIGEPIARLLGIQLRPSMTREF